MGLSMNQIHRNWPTARKRPAIVAAQSWPTAGKRPGVGPERSKELEGLDFRRSWRTAAIHVRSLATGRGVNFFKTFNSMENRSPLNSFFSQCRLCHHFIMQPALLP